MKNLTAKTINLPEGYSPVYEGVSEDNEIPTASNVTWEDNFFKGEEDVIAVFDFDYALMESFDVKVGWARIFYEIGSAMFYPPLALVPIVCLEPCFLQKRVKWDVYSKHLCITRDGVRFVHDKRPTLYGCSCTDAGKSSKTVPFDKITDCDITEPAGNSCLFIENVLSTVKVDTASSSATKHELVLRGLKDPHGFKKLVWAMKRSNGAISAATLASVGAQAIAPTSELMTRNSLDIDHDNVLLLKEIRDELREQTKLLKSKMETDKSECETKEKQQIPELL